MHIRTAYTAAIAALLLIGGEASRATAAEVAGAAESARAPTVAGLGLGQAPEALVAALRTRLPADAVVEELAGPIPSALLAERKREDRRPSTDRVSRSRGVRAHAGSKHRREGVFEEWIAYFSPPPREPAAFALSHERFYGDDRLPAFRDVLDELRGSYGQESLRVEEGTRIALTWIYQPTGELVREGAPALASVCPGGGSPVLDELRDGTAHLARCGGETVVQASVGRDATRSAFVRKLRVTMWNGALRGNLPTDGGTSLGSDASADSGS